MWPIALSTSSTRTDVVIQTDNALHHEGIVISNQIKITAIPGGSGLGAKMSNSASDGADGVSMHTPSPSDVRGARTGSGTDDGASSMRGGSPSYRLASSMAGTVCGWLHPVGSKVPCTAVVGAGLPPKLLAGASGIICAVGDGCSSFASLSKSAACSAKAQRMRSRSCSRTYCMWASAWVS